MEIRHDSADGRFVLERDGEEAFLEYRVLADPKVIHFVRTWVPPVFRGGGLGARLVKAGLEHARAEGYRVTTSCWFVEEFLDRTPAHENLLTD